MKKSPVSSNSLGTFLSPGPPSYLENGAFSGHKGWSSERVPHPSVGGSGSSRRQIGSASVINTPFYSGRTLPSKWEDAERWICSPVGLYPGGVCKNASVNSNYAEQRRPKSKSGPIVPPSPAIGYYNSPAVQAPPGLMVGSPFSTGVLEADRVFRGNSGQGNGHDNGWSDLVSEASTPSSLDDEARDAENMFSPVVISRRDMATQMSPSDSPNRSPPLIRSVLGQQHENPSKAEVREVQVDRRANVIKRSKKQSTRTIKRGPPEAEDGYRNSPGASASAWDVSGSALTISKLQREEAKITAWENLQRAKAEAAMRKLEVKLEKKKSESMDRILNRLRKSQLKAQEMRDSISGKQDKSSKTSGKIVSLNRHPNTLLRSLRSCFTRHAK